MYVFIDDSGDAGMKFNRGSSTHLVMAACVVPDRAALESIERVMRSMPDYLRTAGEFKHAKMKDVHKDEFFARLVDEVFDVRAIIVDKRELSQGFLQLHGNELKIFFIHQLLVRDCERMSDALVLIDGADVRAFGCSGSSYVLNQANLCGHGSVRQVVCRDSKRELGLQLTDMVAGTIMTGVKKGAPVTSTDRWAQVWHRAHSSGGVWWEFRG
ncbi:DUF3800 domain-containing protein [Arcanobacterium haemolyticum]|uniref:DUF3800 domain-containing protein n=1 Tax=Arcanobacterium haemolyticum (strain ATCC 9345 / DSM 20595 / CCM 5947 / CCUG 17215 / LMG 16163 / NBRC 15585 / NCTC 8452 / 11018) TaxID=644284 RepID=D7BL95_ARCHD|nr:DUF3800 domain-containing protein [Arcanobacterium haemolyticum]ADH93425.1 conserved hypothetical protein [Arcanobacterium haemolyticum DSM 20595]QCX47422.1 DUF3800 domain-containing protein [Arcanobacterium haemolyticum]SQH27626.1 Protein of uncharacterised function (DUF3800) [Arcanobacterium haemolyticum]